VPAGKQALADALLRGPLHVVTPPADTRPDSKVSVGKPGAAVLNAALVVNVMSAPYPGEKKVAARKAHRKRYRVDGRCIATV